MSFLIPSRTTRPGDDPIFALNAEARARAQRGERVINATVGSLLDDRGQLATLPSVVGALGEIPATQAAAYAAIGGSPDFLRGVARDLLGEHELRGTKAREIVASVATPGGTGALRHAIANFLEPGQKLLTTSFYWGPYKTLADEADRGLATFPMFDASGALDTGAFRRELEALLRAQGRALLLLNSPCHNPTGYSFDKREWSAVRGAIEELAELGPIAVCLDVAYARFGAQPLGVMLDEMVALAPRALPMFAWSASKTFLQYGLRVGALVTVHPDDDERRRIQSALNYSCRGVWSNVNAGGMAGLAKVLGDEARTAEVDRERAAMVELLARRVARWNELAGPAGLRYPRYDGGFFTTVFCDDALAKGEQLKERGLFVVPQAGALRVALCSVSEADIPALVEGIAAVVRG
jgi:aromatic-amino-acid transaminase